MKMEKIKDKSVIVTGLGRCGTWWVGHSIKGKFDGFGSFFNFGDIEFKEGFFYKTHDYPPPSILPFMRIIFMFGNPMNIIKSAMDNFDFLEPMKGRLTYNTWEAFYKFHNADVIDHKDIYLKDTLHLEENFDRWYRPQTFPFIALKYETLQDINLDPLYEFLGFKFDLIPFKKRKSEWIEDSKSDLLSNTYKGLNEKVNNAEPIKIFNKPIKVIMP